MGGIIRDPADSEILSQPESAAAPPPPEIMDYEQRAPRLMPEGKLGNLANSASPTTTIPSYIDANGLCGTCFRRHQNIV